MPQIVEGMILSTGIIAVSLIINSQCPVTVFPYDDLFLIDGMWRIVQGQRAGTDFYNPIGFGLFHIGAAWLQMLGPHRYVLALTSATFSAVIMLCATIIAARRVWFSHPYYLLTCGVLAFEASGPGVYGWSVFTMGMAAFYNRLSAAALAALFLQWFADRRSSQHPQLVSEALIAATLLNILFLVKISALALAAIIIAASLVVRSRPLLPAVRLVLLVSIIFTAMLATDLVLAGVTPDAIIHDYREAAAVRSNLASWDGVWRALKSLAVIVSALLLTIYARRSAAVSCWRSTVAIATYAIAQIGLNVSNTQPATIYLAPMCVVVLLSWHQRSIVDCNQTAQALARTLLRKSPVLAMPMVICLLVLVPQALSSVAGAAVVAAVASGIKTPIVISSGKGLALPVLGGFGDAGRATDFATNINRGLKALQDLNITHEVIASVDYANPFPALLGTPSPKGVPVVWALGYMETFGFLSQPQALLGDACIVMLPLRPTQVVEGSAELLTSAAEPILSTSFTLALQNDYWKIYRRNHGCS